MHDIAHNLLVIKNKIREFEKYYQRNPDSVKLIAVSKHQSLEKIQAAIDAGQTAFGENYLQEALEKIIYFSKYDIEWHFIGPIQRNKTKKIAEHFSWVQTIDSVMIAKRLHDQRPDHLPPLNICLQVNISDEKNKSGISPENIFELATYCTSLSKLQLRGLMTIPARCSTFEEQRIQLHRLKLVYDELIAQGFPLDTLSMGMSDDMQAAIAEKSTLVRIGTAIFGKRV
jgi:pyridoxal phosphate enzyme (YggS family)